MYHWQRNVTGTTGGCTIGNGMLPELLEDVPLGTNCCQKYWRMYHWERDEKCGLYMIGQLLVLPATFSCRPVGLQLT